MQCPPTSTIKFEDGSPSKLHEHPEPTLAMIELGMLGRHLMIPRPRGWPSWKREWAGSSRYVSWSYNQGEAKAGQSCKRVASCFTTCVPRLAWFTLAMTPALPARLDVSA